MKSQHKKQSTEYFFDPKKGELVSLCCNKESVGSPFLVYTYVEDQTGLNRAFDILFEELLASDLLSHESDKINRDLLPGLDLEARG